MNKQWSQEQIQRVRDMSIRSALDIKSGRRRVMIKCPMPEHRDSSPSFLLDEDNGFYCFGCGARGSGFIDLLTSLGFKFQDIMNEYGSN